MTASDTATQSSWPEPATRDEFLAECVLLAKRAFAENDRNFYDPFGGSLRHWGEAEFFVDADLYERWEQDVHGILDCVGYATRMLCCFTPEGYRQMRTGGRTFHVQQFHAMELYAPFLDRSQEEFRCHLADMGIEGRSAAAHLAHLARRKRAVR